MQKYAFYYISIAFALYRHQMTFLPQKLVYVIVAPFTSSLYLIQLYFSSSVHTTIRSCLMRNFNTVRVSQRGSALTPQVISLRPMAMQWRCSLQNCRPWYSLYVEWAHRVGLIQSSDRGCKRQIRLAVLRFSNLDVCTSYEQNSLTEMRAPTNSNVNDRCDGTKRMMHSGTRFRLWSWIRCTSKILGLSGAAESNWVKMSTCWL